MPSHAKYKLQLSPLHRTLKYVFHAQRIAKKDSLLGLFEYRYFDGEAIIRAIQQISSRA